MRPIIRKSRSIQYTLKYLKFIVEVLSPPLLKMSSSGIIHIYIYDIKTNGVYIVVL